jgi:hypothetical protein
MTSDEILSFDGANYEKKTDLAKHLFDWIFKPFP